MNNREEKVADAVEQSWVYRLVPSRLWPFAQLARWERPIGWWLLMWPGWWSIMLAMLAKLQTSPTNDQDLGSVLTETALLLLLFMVGAIVMRGAGCTYNDLADRDIDDRVARTRSRPLPSGRVTTLQAVIFMLLQSLIGLFILLQFNSFSIWLGVASLITVVVYPFMKRITWWPQLFLGFAFSWGALLGWSVVAGGLGLPPLLLYLASIAWVIGYDTIYAHQDKEDDALVGVKSTARLFGDKTKPVIFILYSIAITLMAVAFFMALFAQSGAYSEMAYTAPAFLGLFIGAIHMLWQLKMMDIDNPDQCLKLFKSNGHFGWILFAGLTGSLLLRVI
ncbi:MAG: 4-hydroxybenzoate octaprenyltransferase [Hyphomicrobiales bacterium]|nr:4-hydroxybenzoate octaprenyltransferase [Hyphomicrobiales bacterium]